MKNKKRVLIILLTLIIILLTILCIVLFFGGLREREINEFKETVENKTCEFAKKENYTETICNSYENLCKIRFKTLIDKEYLSKDMINPITNNKISEDTDVYVEILWKDGKISCTYKEG